MSFPFGTRIDSVFFSLTSHYPSTQQSEARFHLEAQPNPAYRKIMRSHQRLRTGLGSVLLTLLAFGMTAQLRAQDRSAQAAAYIAQQQAEERYRRLYTVVEDLQSANVVLQQRIERLESQLQRAIKSLNEQQADNVTTEQLDSLSKKVTQEIQIVENKRLADNKKILSELKKIANRPAPAPKQPIAKTPKPALEPYTGPVYEITIEPDYTISGIAQKYREQGHMISANDILRANPGLDPRRLQPGQVIKIPAKQ